MCCMHPNSLPVLASSAARTTSSDKTPRASCTKLEEEKKERKKQTQIRRCAHFLIGVSLGVQTHKCDLHAHALLSVASVSSRRESRAHRHSRRLETEPILSVIIDYLTVDFTAL